MWRSSSTRLCGISSKAPSGSYSVGLERDLVAEADGDINGKG